MPKATRGPQILRIAATLCECFNQRCLEIIRLYAFLVSIQIIQQKKRKTVSSSSNLVSYLLQAFNYKHLRKHSLHPSQLILLRCKFGNCHTHFFRLLQLLKQPNSNHFSSTKSKVVQGKRLNQHLVLLVLDLKKEKAALSKLCSVI